MVSIKISLFLALMLSFTAIKPIKNPQDITFTDYTKAHAIIAGSYLTYKGLATIASGQEKYLVAQKYPYAQAWYEEMTKKYPSARLDQQKFFYCAPWMSQNYMAWQSAFNNIYCSEVTLKKINRLYEQKINSNFPKNLIFKEDTTNDSEIDLKIAEFLLLREAYHCTYKTIFTLPAIFGTKSIAISLLLEGINGIYPQFNPNYAAQSIFASFFYIKIAENQELDADKFAYQTATDFNVFNGAFAYFAENEFDDLFKLKPALYIRIETLNNEFRQAINRR